MTAEIIFIFSGANCAIQAEAALLAAGFDVRVMPLPSVILAGCGLCLRLFPKDAGAAKCLLENQDIPFQQLYKRTIEDGKSVYTEWKAD